MLQNSVKHITKLIKPFLQNLVVKMFFSSVANFCVCNFKKHDLTMKYKISPMNFINEILYDKN